MSNSKSPRKGRVHSFGDALDAKVERASKALGFAPTSEIAPVIDTEAGEELNWLYVDLIDDNPFQPRTEYPNDAQLDLIHTMNEDGQLMPIGVRPHPTIKGRYQARFGHRRKYAVGTGAIYTDDTGEERRIYANAGVKQPNPSSFVGKIWCVVRKASDAEMRREAWQENKARLDIPVMDQARFFVGTREALGQNGKPASWQKTAEFLGESDRVYVYRVGSLLDLPKEMKAALEVGPKGEKPLLNERHGRALLLLQTADAAESHKKAQRELFREIKKELLSGAETERRALERRQFLAKKTPSKEDEQLFEYQKQEKKDQSTPGGTTTEKPQLRSVSVSTEPAATAPGATLSSGQQNEPDQTSGSTVVAEKDGKEIASAPVSSSIARVSQMIEASQKTLSWARGQIEAEPEIEPLACEALIALLKKVERESRAVRSALELKIDPSRAEKEYEGDYSG